MSSYTHKSRCGKHTIDIPEGLSALLINEEVLRNCVTVKIAGSSPESVTFASRRLLAQIRASGPAIVSEVG